MFLVDFQQKVKDFMVAAGQKVAEKPQPLDLETAHLRIRLCKEELGELEKAKNDGCKICIADAIADLLYVVIGTGVSCGVKITSVFVRCPYHEFNPDNLSYLFDAIKLGVSNLRNSIYGHSPDDISTDLLLIIDSTLKYSELSGIYIEPIFNEVHRSNMTKFIDGHLDEGGKWIKGPSYSPADLMQFFSHYSAGRECACQTSQKASRRNDSSGGLKE